MPKNNVTILKDAADILWSARFRVEKFTDDSIVNYLRPVPHSVKSSYIFKYGEGTIIFQHVCPDILLCVLFVNHDDKYPELVKEIDGDTYQIRKEKINDILQIIMDGTYEGCNVKSIIPAIEKV